MSDVVSKDSNALNTARSHGWAPHPLVWATIGCLAFWWMVISAVHL
jgi:hypothetical protein